MLSNSRLLICPWASSWVLAIFMTGSVANPLVAQNKYTSEQLQRHFQNTAESYSITTSETTLKLRSQPLMNWFNNERQQDQGSLYVWESEGRPIVLGSIFTYEYNSRVFCRHELISLSETSLKATLDSQVVWSPQSPGVEWRTVASPSEAARASNRRLIEMRSFARQFSGLLRLPNAQSSKLTFLPQPLHRYESTKYGITDGAIFSFAVGTDPEILLVVEAKEEAGKAVYRYCPLRSHYHAVELQRDGVLVWSAPSIVALEMTIAGEQPYANQPFFVLTPPKPLPAPEELDAKK